MPRSEFDLIAALRAQLPADGPRVEVGSGDDAAVVRAGGAHSVVSVDTTVDGVHARLDLGDPVEAARSFGWRALTTALSDLAAMGVGDAAGSTEAYVALTLPAAFPDETAIAVTAGLGAAAARYGTSVVGGDVTSGPVVIATVTVIGWAGPALGPGAAEAASAVPSAHPSGPASPSNPAGAAVLTRGGAQPGDLIGLTSPLGSAAAGLALHLGTVDPATLPAVDVDRLLAAYLRPEPQLHKGAALRRAGATAAIDLSDGLLQDAGHVAAASDATLRLYAELLPLGPSVDAVAVQLGAEPAQFAATAGEDFALLVTVPPANRAAAARAGVTAWIGEVAAGPAGVELDGAALDPAATTGGFDHRR